MSADQLIAVVDDDASAREAVLGLVRALGFAARGFDSAATFLSSAVVPRTNCVVADVRMPGMTGLELHRHLLASQRLIPTILMTAFPDEPTRLRALGEGVRCYLARPFTPEALLACLRLALAHHHETERGTR